MIGDVNIFLLKEFQSSDYLRMGGEVVLESSGPAATAASAASSSTHLLASKPTRICEIMIMIAAETERRKGHAIHALTAIMKYGEFDSRTGEARNELVRRMEHSMLLRPRPPQSSLAKPTIEIKILLLLPPFSTRV